jgi:hypothetical protein
METHFQNKYTDCLLQHRNYYAMYYCFLFFIIIICQIVFFTLYKPLNDSDISIITGTSIFNILLVLVSAVWSYKIAKRKGHFAGIWFFIGLYTGPVGLFVISNMYYHTDVPQVKKIIESTKQELIQKIKENIKNKELLINEYMGILKIRLNDELVNTYEKAGKVKEMIDENVVNQYINSSKKIELLNLLKSDISKDEQINWNPAWLEQENICPACGKELDNEMKICSECGLRLE